MLAVLQLIISLLVALISVLLWILGRRIPPRFERKSITCEYGKSGSIITEGVAGLRLKAEHNSRLIDDPHVMRLRVSNTGGSDLTEGMFAGGRPLEFDFGAEVIAVSKEFYHPGSALELDAAVSGSTFSLGPGLIPRGMSACYLVLTDGICMEVRCKNPVEHAELKEVLSLEEGAGYSGFKVKVIVQWLLIAFVLWWIVMQPGNAGHLVDSIGSSLSNAARGLADFVASF